jgi:hypothetical protein
MRCMAPPSEPGSCAEVVVCRAPRRLYVRAGSLDGLSNAAKAAHAVLPAGAMLVANNDAHGDRGEAICKVAYIGAS